MEMTGEAEARGTNGLERIGDGQHGFQVTRLILVFVSAVAAAVVFALTLAAPSYAAGEFEPNDSRDTAYGPLAGGKSYTATFETENDTDWYVFYIKTYSQMDFSATTVYGCDYRASIALYDKDGEDVDYFRPGYVNETERLLLTMNPGRYYLEVRRSSACVGDRYRFRIDPAASITTSFECGEAIVAKDAVAPFLDNVNNRLTKNGEILATKTAVVRESKGELRRAGKRAKRLRKQVMKLRNGKKLRQIRSKLKRARSGRTKAAGRLDRAKADRRPIWKEQKDLETLAQQHQQTVSNAEAQIEAHC